MSVMEERLRRAIVAEVYRRADGMDWDALTNRQHTEVYDQWLDAPAIGGQLTRFMTRERARVWLKDVPMKEYTRARNGIGTFADLVTVRYPSPGQIAKQVLGQEWDVAGPTLNKPARCVVSDGRQQRFMMWGPQKTFRDIIWAGINALVDQRPTPVLVVTVPRGQILDEGEKRRNNLIGKQVGLEVRHVALKMVQTISRLHADQRGHRPLAYSSPRLQTRESVIADFAAGSPPCCRSLGRSTARRDTEVTYVNNVYIQVCACRINTDMSNDVSMARCCVWQYCQTQVVRLVHDGQ